MHKGIAMPMRETLDELTTVAAALNQQSDELNALIDDFEEHLESAGVGVSVWLDSLIDESDWYEEQDGGSTWDECRAWRLGYTKLGDGWHVAAKEVRLQRNHCDDRGHPYEPVPGEDTLEADISKPIALTRAPRVVRMQAAAHLEPLAIALTEKMKSYIKSITAAKKVVKD